MRRRLAVIAAVLASLVGEWLGHSISYYRAAGLPGLVASLTGGVHDYMVPLSVALLAGAALGATCWMRAWTALGHRLDRSAAAVQRLRFGREHQRAERCPPSPTESPSWTAGVLALWMPMAAIQCSLYLVQENLERAAHGLSGSGLSPLLDGHGAALWIQGSLALLMACAVALASRLLRRRVVTAERLERLVRTLWLRAQRRTSSPRPRLAHVRTAQLLLRNALWGRPPPVPTAA